MEKEGLKNQVAKWFPLDTQYWNCCKPPNKGYAGTAILISKDFGGPKPLKVTYDFGVPKHASEGRVVTVEFDKFDLVAVYVPNAGVDGLKRLDYRVKEWDVDFQRYLKDTETQSKKPVIVCGDLNVAHQEIDIFGPKGKERRAGFTVEERTSFGNFLKNAEFIDTFRHKYPKLVKYSYWNLRSGARQKNQGWRLDYFLVSGSMTNAVINSEINDEYWGSDHCPLSLTLDIDRILLGAAMPVPDLQKVAETV